LPFAWKTTSVRVGALELVVDSASERRVDDFRFEYRHGFVTEAYDVRADGVEQTFVIVRRPDTTGDLVVAGEIRTELVGDRIEPTHGPIVFRGPKGERIVEYGSATAIDARGRAFPMTSAFDGDRIELRLEADALASVSFPLVVDPLIGNDPVRYAGMTAVAATAAANPTDPNGISVYTRISSASDHDVFGVLTRPGFQLVTLVFGDVSTSYSSEKVAVGAMDLQGVVLIAAERRQGFKTSLEYYTHDVSSAGYRSGVSTVLNAANGEHFRNPAIGGNKTSHTALLVYDYTQPGTGVVTIEGRRVFWSGASSILTSSVAAPSAFNHERSPAVAPYSSDHEGWLVAWAASDVGSGEIFGRKVFPSGAAHSLVDILQPATGSIYRQVRVAGGHGRFVTTFRSVPTGIGIISLRARRFDWPDGGSVTQKQLRTISGGSLPSNGGLAHDFETNSHWIAAYTVSTGAVSSELRADRLGYTAAVVESRVIDTVSTPFVPSVAFDPRPGNALYEILYAQLNGASNSVLGASYEYPAVAYTKTRFNSGCGSADDDESDPALSGSQFFASRLLTHDNAPAALFFSRLSSALPLDIIGMPGCILSVEPALTLTYPATLNAANEFEVTFPLPDSPLFNVTFYTQWVWTSIGANALGVVVNSGVAHQAQ
ncbi:MAG: hypothetical protein KDB80_06510, partial [Planctomycetes bacterium]|nr:hypothetical protein [Planctomycetota bacterium]